MGGENWKLQSYWRDLQLPGFAGSCASGAIPTDGKCGPKIAPVNSVYLCTDLLDLLSVFWHFLFLFQVSALYKNALKMP